MRTRRGVVVLIALLCVAGSVDAAEIHEALKAGDAATVAALIAAEPTIVNARDERGRTPLHWAARGTSNELLALLVEKGADVNAADTDGVVPIHSLASRGNAAGIAILLAGGADVDRQAADGSSALHHAAQGGHLEAVRALVAAKADLERRNAYGRTPLSIAAREMAGVEVVRLLLDLGADIDTTDQSGDSPLTLAAWRGTADVVSLLVERKAKLPADAAERAQLLGTAATTGLDALFFRLLEAGVELPGTGDAGQSLIAAAAEGGSAKIIDALLARGLSANETDGNGWTPLHFATDLGRLQAIALLLERGADANARTAMGQSVVNVAEDNDDEETKAFLVARGAPQEPPAFPELTGAYLGQKKPGRTAEPFAPGIVSGRYGLHAMPTFSPDGTEAFWSVMVPARTPGYSGGRTLVSRLADGRWTYPRHAVFAGTKLEDVPCFHPDGTALYDMARRPLPGTEAAAGRGEAIWVWTKGGPDGWFDPRPLGDVVNSVPHHWQFAVDRAGTVYFGTTIAGGAGDSDLYRSRLVAGAYQPPENLGAAINTAAREGLPYVSPDGRTLLFNRDRDIWASFLTQDGAWTRARPLGAEVNTPAMELLPSLSPDGKYLFFSRSHRCYWVDASFLEELRADAIRDAGSLPPADGSEPAADPRDPESNFEHVWRTIDRTYGQFSVKNVDWAMLHRIYRPQVTSATTDEELWDILVTMLGTLNDSHVCLADGTRRVCGGIGPAELTPDTWARDFSLELVKTTYLHGTSSALREGTFTSGWLADGIGYLHMADLKGPNEPTVQAIDAFLGEFGPARALVVDARANPGGANQNHEIVANRFADRRRQYAQSQVRYGPKHDDLLPTEYRDVAPDGPVQFTKPVVLLTHRSTASGPEGLTLAMRVLPHVTVVGDLTEGALSAQFPERLPNGWTLFVAFKVFRDHEGICWDGVGIPPDIRVVNTPEEIAAGRDRQLELALQLLERGAPEPQDESASVAHLRTSLVAEYDRIVRDQGVEAAVAARARARAARADASFFGVDEAMQSATRYLGSQQYPAAIGLLEACREEAPRLAAMYAMLAKAWLGAGDVAKAEAVMAQAESVEPMYPWERPQIERAKLALRKAKLGSAGRIFGQALAEGGVPAAEKTLGELQAGGDAGPVFDEGDFNALGYQLLQSGDVASAVYVFETCVHLYPDSWNAHDSLGEALLTAGRKEEGLEHYRRSLELNPGNRGAKRILEESGG